MAKQVNNSAQEHTNKKPEPAQVDVTNEKDVDKATETNYQASVNSNVKPEGTENPEDAEKPEDDHKQFQAKFSWLLPDLVE